MQILYAIQFAKHLIKFDFVGMTHMVQPGQY